MKKNLFILFSLSLIFSACGSDDDSIISLKESSTTTKSGTTYQIQATSDYDITYESENEYYATVSSSGLITASRVGETNIKVLSNGEEAKFKITITPSNTLYEEPYLVFGTTKADLIKKLGTPEDEVKDGIVYTHASNTAPISIYYFDLNGKLEASIIYIAKAYGNESLKFLNERYLYVGFSESDEDNDEAFKTYVYANALNEKGTTMLIGNTMYEDFAYWIIAYTPYSPEKQKSEKFNDIKALTKEVNALPSISIK